MTGRWGQGGRVGAGVLGVCLGGVAVASLTSGEDVRDVMQGFFAGERDGEALGTTVLVAEDVNGDGWPDVVVGAPGYDGGKGAVAIFLGDGAAQPASTTLGEADLLFYGATGDEAGTSLATGDFNGDGLSDLAVGAPKASALTGLVYIVMGDDAWTSARVDQSLSALPHLSGEAALEQCGRAVAALDLDGDGLDDLAIGAPSAGDDAGGIVYLGFGRRTAGAPWASGPVSVLDGVIDGVANSALGYSLARVPSFNGDGPEDLAIGAPDGQGDDFGRVHVVPGRTRTSLTGSHGVETLRMVSFKGASAADGTGLAVSAAGDLTGDGRDELLIGSPSHSGGASSQGKVWLIASTTWGSGSAEVGVGSAALASWIGRELNARLGSTVRGPGDLDGDGVPDLLIAATRSGDASSSSRGEVWVVSGGQAEWLQEADLDADGQALGSFRGISSADKLGVSLSRGVDTDADGRLEVVVGAPGSQVKKPAPSTGTAVAGVAVVVDLLSILDRDGDGFDIVGLDCDDQDPDVYPGAEELPWDGIDQDCNGADLDDVDEDGFVGILAGGDDCDDEDEDVYPGAHEIPYDDIDQDCDGSDLTDLDEDGYDAEEAGGDDCDDTLADVNPGAGEIPYDGIDQDCSGADLLDVDGDGSKGEAGGGDDCDDTDPTIAPGASEVPYDGIDQDCDGGDLVDVDRDNHASTEAGGDDCDDTNPKVFPGRAESCDGIDQDCDALIDEGFDTDRDGHLSAITCPTLGDDCDDRDPTVHPGQAEICDGADQDCDGAVDEGVLTSYYPDGDDDGYGVQPATLACTPPAGHTAVAGDCDDAAPTTHPGATETCDDGVDQDCSGADLSCTPVDADGDTFTVEDGDCDDTNNKIYPGAREVPYDGIDQDCDGADLTDVDGDGFDANAAGGRDCDDRDEDIHPGAPERCDGEDNNCDGEVDEGCETPTEPETPTPTPDTPTPPPETPTPPPDTPTPPPVETPTAPPSAVDADDDGYPASTDCDDTNPDVHPDAPESCADGQDTNCDGAPAEGCIRAPGLSCDHTPTPGAGAAVLLLLLGVPLLRRRR